MLLPLATYMYMVPGIAEEHGETALIQVCQLSSLNHPHCEADCVVRKFLHKSSTTSL